MPPPSKPPLLVVHGDGAEAKTIARMLAGAYRIYTCSLPQRAEAFLAGHRVDLLIVTRDLPGMPALDWLYRIACDHPDLIRLLLASAPLRSAEREALSAGLVHHWLPAPVVPDRLRAVVAGFFPAYQIRRRLLQRRKNNDGIQ